MQNRSSIIKKISVGVIIILLLITVFFVSKLVDFWQAVNTTSASTSVDKQGSEEKHVFNILLLGYAGPTLQGGYLTDSMILLHANIKDNIVMLISIPRDLWVKIPVAEGELVSKKINTAYSVGLSDKSYPNKSSRFMGESGGGNMVKYVVGRALGMDIDYYVALDFKAFVDVVDAIGGVEVRVDKTVDDREYPREGYEDDTCGRSEEELVDLDQKLATISALQYFPCRYEHLIIPAGMQQLDGVTALKFVRSRHGVYDGSDFGRADRQQKLLIAVKDKVLSLSFIPKIPGLLDSLSDKIRTDIPYDFFTKLLTERIKFDDYQIRHLVLSDQNFLQSDFSTDRQYILRPEGNDWSDLQDWIDTLITVKRSQYPQIFVKNAAGIEGLASTAAERLSARGLGVEEVSNASISGQLTTDIVVKQGSVDGLILFQIEEEFNTQVKSVSPKPSDTSVMEINLGSDYQKQLQ